MNMYTLFSVVFLLGAISLFGGFIWRTSARGGLDSVSADVASALGLIAVYAVVLAISDSAPDFVQSICNGIPYIGAISDYGSLANAYKANPVQMWTSFFDVVVLSAIVDLIKPLLGAGERVPRSMRKMFAAIVSGLLGLVVLNVVIKNLGAYSAIVSVIGAAVTLFSSLSLGFAAIRAITQTQLTTGFLAVVGTFMVGSVSETVRKSFFKALVYVLIIYLLEYFCGSFGAGVSLAVDILIAAAPVFIVGAGLALVLRSIR